MQRRERLVGGHGQDEAGAHPFEAAIHGLGHAADGLKGLLDPLPVLLDFRAPEIRFLVEDDVPSVRAGLRLRSGQWIEFYGVHPRPPEVQEDTEERDAEILIVGQQIAADGRPSIVAGDLNAVAWSDTTRQFQKISGTLDPRRGRGTFNTFHARYPFLRWPLDHVFHEASFTLIRLERLRGIGSDHFPVFAALQFEPKAETRQEAPQADAEDHDEAREKITDGRQERRVV